MVSEDNKMPNETDYYNTLLCYLKTTKPYIYNILKNGHCELIPDGKYSQKNIPFRHRYRWNAYSIFIYFYVPIIMIDKVTPELEDELCDICNTLIERKLNHDVVKVSIAPKISNEVESKIEHTITDIGIPLEIIPSNIQQNATYMGKYYVYVYYTENILREFIKKISIIHFGTDNYFEHLVINESMKSKIKERRDNKDLWLSDRSDDNIFYVDFTDLNLIIKNNWDIFKEYFPDQAWIKSKVDDIYKCRNKIAHNTSLSELDKNVIKTHFQMIIHQLKSNFED